MADPEIVPADPIPAPVAEPQDGTVSTDVTGDAADPDQVIDGRPLKNIIAEIDRKTEQRIHFSALEV